MGLVAQLPPCLIGLEACSGAQDKKTEKAKANQVTIKELGKNDQFRAYEAVFKPGDEGAAVERPPRVVRALTAGTLERTYPDGKKELSVYKAGEVKIFGADPVYSLKNVGKTTLHLFVVSPPPAKK